MKLAHESIEIMLDTSNYLNLQLQFNKFKHLFLNEGQIACLEHLKFGEDEINFINENVNQKDRREQEIISYYNKKTREGTLNELDKKLLNEIFPTNKEFAMLIRDTTINF